MSRILLISALIFPIFVFGAEAFKQGKDSDLFDSSKVEFPPHAVVKTVAKLSENLLSVVSNGVLCVVWDADLTLCRPQGLRVVDHVKKLQDLMMRLSPEEKDDFQATVAALPMSLVNVGIPEIINALNAKGAKSIVLTARLAGKLTSAFDSDESMEERTYQQLKRLGVNLTEDFGGACEKEVDSPLYHGHKPVFHKGVLVENGEYGPGCGKGGVLVKFLQGVAEIPETIIMVDDKKENLDSVRDALRENFPNTKFYGIQYLEAYLPGDVSPPPQGFDYSGFLSACLSKTDPLALPRAVDMGVSVNSGDVPRAKKKQGTNGIQKWPASANQNPFLPRSLNPPVKSRGITLQVGAELFLKKATDPVVKIAVSGVVSGYLEPKDIVAALWPMTRDPKIHSFLRFMDECMRDGSSDFLFRMRRLSIKE